MKHMHSGRFLADFEASFGSMTLPEVNGGRERGRGWEGGRVTVCHLTDTETSGYQDHKSSLCEIL